MKALIREETDEKKKLIYRAPLPRKKQRCTHYKEKNGKVKVFSQEEILIYESCPRRYYI